MLYTSNTVLVCMYFGFNKSDYFVLTPFAFLFLDFLFVGYIVVGYRILFSNTSIRGYLPILEIDKKQNLSFKVKNGCGERIIVLCEFTLQYSCYIGYIVPTIYSKLYKSILKLNG